ncbi:nucleotide exchange factor GrpE [Leucobacter chromiireducens]|uniref:Protein GrpE n=1 Tax=Leucobacter chromiireducens subsp. chromiireducens TaxID=660067 RepID=A0ABS1SKK0_9MICO|nr:nucleotide exchange factor GrpE [Leucobacter chromiireducens]MBL3688613.1 nucleotide exchange factor GrpE [Leucobacter chromiireducens subsp. chromiireducens]
MTNKEQHTPGSDDEFTGSEVPAAGSEANASGPEPQQEDLTVDDILNAEQSDAAAGADAEAGEAENPYLEDLRRLTAEYANYRKRTEANAVLEKQRAIAAAVTPLLSVLDDLDRAEQHGDLTEGSAFATIGQKLRSTLERFGLSSFGEKGEPFDPQVHEAIAQVPVPGTEQDTVLDVIERGYRLGDVELRPAKVAVAVGADG